MQITRGITGIWQISQNKNVSNAVPLKIRFFIPPTAYGMYHLPLSYSVQDFETYTGITSGGSNHEHTVTIPDHSHSVTTTNHSHSVTTSHHSHSVTTSNHSHSVTTTNHSHSVTTSNHSHNITMWDYTDTQDCYLVGMQDRAGNYTLSQAVGGPANIIDNSGGGEVVSSASGGGEVVSSASGGGEVVSSESGGGEVVSSESGGGEVVSSASGGGTTPTSSVESTHTHTIEASMGTTPADCNDITVSVDGVDKTSELEAKYGTLPVTDAQDLDLFEYLSEPILNAWHEVIITPNGINTPAGMCYIYAYLSPETVVKEV